MIICAGKKVWKNKNRATVCPVLMLAYRESDQYYWPTGYTHIIQPFSILFKKKIIYFYLYIFYFIYFDFIFKKNPRTCFKNMGIISKSGVINILYTCYTTPYS